jgi:plastocyanin
MRKLLFLVVAVASLTAAGAATRQARTAVLASPTVTITATGYKPTAVSVQVGDSVDFANKDTVSHTVAFKQSLGFHCASAFPFEIPAGQTAGCTFLSPGKYNFFDPAHKGNKFRGTVTVGTPLTSGPLTASPKLVVYGRKSTVAGTLLSKQSGQSVQIQGTECGTTTSKLLATVTTTTGGKFSYSASPLKKTAYAAKVKNSTSAPATAAVQPRLQLKKVGRHRYSVSVSAAESFAGKLATLQRYRSATKRWVKVKRVLLKANTTGVAPTVISSAKFGARIRSGVQIRVSLGSKQVGLCYAAGHSNAIRS